MQLQIEDDPTCLCFSLLPKRSIAFDLFLHLLNSVDFKKQCLLLDHCLVSSLLKFYCEMYSVLYRKLSPHDLPVSAQFNHLRIL